MSKLKILTSPTYLLRTKCQKVKDFGPNFQKFIDDFVKTLKLSKLGIGLSAPQVGRPLQVVACYFKSGKENIPSIPLTILVNPKITLKSAEQEILEEGCLSFPEIYLPIERSTQVHIIGQDRFGKRLKIRTKGLFARVLQHEIDHLGGILFLNRAKMADGRALSDLKILFFGTPAFAVPILENLNFHFKVVGVVSEPDKPAGRGLLKIKIPEVVKTAKKLHLPYFQPENLKDKKILNQIKGFSPDLIVLSAYGKIIPQDVLKIPKLGSLNIHPSLLPKFRGPTPIQTAILEGEKTTGVSVILMDEKIDHGPILEISNLTLRQSQGDPERSRGVKSLPRCGISLREKISNFTTEELSKKLAKLASKQIIKTICDFVFGKAKPKAQDESQATYSKLLKKEDGRIEKSKFQNPKSKKELEKIERKIRAFYPWPKVWTQIGGKRVIIHKAHVEKLKTKNEKVKTKLILDIVQPEGKKPMKYSEYLKGNPPIV